MKNLLKKLVILIGKDLTVSEKARAQGVTTKVRTVATVNPTTSEPHPYVVVRRNLEALIDRKSFYRFIDLGSIENYKGQEWFGVWSNNCFFPVSALACHAIAMSKKYNYFDSKIFIFY